MAGSLEFIKSASASSVASTSVTDIFTDKYDVYFINLFKGGTSSDTNIGMTFLDSGGTEITASEYDFALLNMTAYASFGESRSTNTTRFATISFGRDNVGQGTGIYVFNPYYSSSYTFIESNAGTFNTGNGLIGRKNIGVHKSAEQLSGVVFKAITSPKTISLEISVYGVK